MSFGSDLKILCMKEGYASQNDADRSAEMIEALASILGASVAIFCNGDPEKVEEIWCGTEAYAHAQAVHVANCIRDMRAAK